jgi:hypothetical protein
MLGDFLTLWLLPLVAATAVGAAVICGVYAAIPEGHLPAWFAGIVLFVLSFLIAHFLAKRWRGEWYPYD